MKLSAIVISAGLLALAAPAEAVNLVTNGGFETGTTAGWTDIGNHNTSYNGVGSGNPHNGTYEYYTGNYPYQGYGGLSQQLATTAGLGYDISLWWLATGTNDAANQGYQVLWNGAVVGQISGATANSSYTNLVYHVFAIGNDTVAFQGFSNAGYNQTDDVSVSANGLGAVPEPTTWAMMLLGFGGIGYALRRRPRVAFHPA